MSFVDTIKERITGELPAVRTEPRRRFFLSRKNSTVQNLKPLEGPSQWSADSQTSNTKVKQDFFNHRPGRSARRTQNDFSALSPERITQETPVIMGTGSVEKVGDTTFFDDEPRFVTEIPDLDSVSLLPRLDISEQVPVVVNARTAGEIIFAQTGEVPVVKLTGQVPASYSVVLTGIDKNPNVSDIDFSAAFDTVEIEKSSGRARKEVAPRVDNSIADLALFISRHRQEAFDDPGKYIVANQKFNSLNIVLRQAGEEFNFALKQYVQDVEDGVALGDFDHITQLKLEMILLTGDISKKPLSDLFPREIKSLQNRIETFNKGINDFYNSIDDTYALDDLRKEADVWVGAMRDVANVFEEMLAPFQKVTIAVKSSENEKAIDIITSGVFKLVDSVTHTIASDDMVNQVNRPTDLRDNTKSIYGFILKNQTALLNGHDLLGEKNNWRSIRSYINKVKVNLVNEKTKFPELKEIDKSMLNLLKYVADGPKRKGYNLEKIESDAIKILTRLDVFEASHLRKDPSVSSSMNRETRERYDNLDNIAHSVLKMSTNGLLKQHNFVTGIDQFSNQALVENGPSLGLTLR